MWVTVIARWYHSVSKVEEKGGAGMFSGKYFPMLDAKNRFFVPAEYRAELGSKVVLLESPEKNVKCVYIYNIDEWDIVRTRIKENLPHTELGRKIKRHIFANIQDAEVDKAGRLTLSAQLRSFAEIEDKEIMIVGNDNHLEVWSTDNWSGDEVFDEDISLDDYNIEF